MTHTRPVAGSSPGLVGHRTRGPRAVRPIHNKIGSATVHLPNDPSVHASQKEKGNDRSSANRPSA